MLHFIPILESQGGGDNPPTQPAVGRSSARIYTWAGDPRVSVFTPCMYS